MSVEKYITKFGFRETRAKTRPKELAKYQVPSAQEQEQKLEQNQKQDQDTRHSSDPRPRPFPVLFGCGIKQPCNLVYSAA